MGNPRKQDVEITAAMIAAADKFLHDLEDARMVKHISLMDGAKGRSSWTRKVKKGPNRDLVIAVTTLKMRQSIATFLVISRAQAVPPRSDAEITGFMNAIGRRMQSNKGV